MSYITNVADCGSIVIVNLDDADPAYFDHRCFTNMCEGLADEDGNVDLRDRPCHVEGEPFEQVLVFDDD